MTYFAVLLTFILPPLLLLLITVPRELWRWIADRRSQVSWQPYWIILAHVLLALIYTSPWDNYLVATGVWWYDPDLVTGITIGYVPLEEYTFFILQTLLTGLWALLVFRRISPQTEIVRPSRLLRRNTSLLAGIVWGISTLLLIAGWKAGTYLTLILSWALIPVIIQAAFGADILLSNARRLAWILLPTTLYLWLVDYLAIQSGTWVINPTQTTGWMVGILPVEEMVFFFMTNLIIGLGITLMLSPESQQRAQAWLARYRSNRARQHRSAA